MIPPTGNTYPVNVISPVIAKSSLIFLLRYNEIKAVAIVIPADGPSLGMAPAGKCIWISWVSNRAYF